ncbi:MAG: histidine kinase [Saprospiraceae bacterium]|nr:histidine kinase [Candidatus Opimibacter iunctus]
MGPLTAYQAISIKQIEFFDEKVICLTLGGSFIHDCNTESDTSLFLSGGPSIPAYQANNMTDACSDGYGGIILLSRSGLLHVDSLLSKKYEYSHQDSTQPSGISSSFGRFVIPMPDGQFLIGGNHGLLTYDPVKKSTTPLYPGIYPALDTFISDRSVHVFELGPFEYLFFSRHQSTLVYYNALTGVKFSLTVGIDALDLLRWNTQLHAINDSLHYCLLPGKGTMDLIIDRAGKQMSLHGIHVTGILPVTMLVDQDHRIWLGTHNGIFMQRDQSGGIRKSAPAFDAQLPEKSHVQFSISGPYLVTGTAEGLEMKFYDKTTLALVKQITITSPQPTYTSSVLHFATYGADSILICTNGPRIWLNTQTWRYQAIEPWEKIPTKFSWYAFQSSLDGTLYTIQNNSTLERYDPLQKKFISLPLNQDMWKKLEAPTQIAEDWNGDLWLVHHGFCRYRKATAQIDYCQPKFPGAFLDRNTVGNMVNDTSHHMLWFTLYQNGLIRYDPATHEYMQFTLKDGLPDLVISQMILVGRHIWIITPSGLASISIDDYNIQRYPYGNGAFLYHSRKALTYDSVTDQLYFMHDQQIMACRPAALLSRSGHARLLIEKIESGDSLWLWPTQSILEIHGKERRLRIQLSSIAFEDMGPLQYTYRQLTGKDTTWRTIGVDGVTVIENLSPGKHDIQFRLQGDGNNLHAAEKKIRIQVFPFFWETNFFLFFLALACLVAMWLLVRWQYQRKKARLDMDRRLSALELQALRSRLNPHFIFNCLNSINRYILKEDKSNASYYLSRFAKLIRHTLDYTSEPDVSLSEEINVTRLYIELESLRMAEPIQLDVHFDPEIEPDNVRVPPLFIQPYVENAIWHGLASKKDNLKLLVRVIKAGFGFVFEIEDNGIGRAAAGLSHRTGQHISKGMAIAKETFDHYGQVYHQKTNIEIIDLFDQSGNACGTCVKLKLTPIL